MDKAGGDLNQEIRWIHALLFVAIPLLNETMGIRFET